MKTRRFYGWEKDCAGNGCPMRCQHDRVIGDRNPIRHNRDVVGHLRRRVTWTVTYSDPEPVGQLALSAPNPKDTP